MDQNLEKNLLLTIPGIVGIKSTDEASSNHLDGLEIMQPMTEHYMRNINRKNYHWLCHSEFSWFLAEAVPIAYGLFKNNLLDFMVSFEGSEPYLPFLPQDKLLISKGTGLNTLGGSPPYLGSKIYSKEYKSINPYWEAPPLKTFYKDKLKLNFKKPLMIINNKLTEEWSHGPINCFYSKDLELLLKTLNDKYAIGYIRSKGNEKGFCNDGSKVLEEDDFSTIKNNCSEYIIIQDLMEQTGITFNTAQCLMHAESSIHISSSGGNAIIASYFGGRNIIIGRGEKFKQRPVWHKDSWLKNLSGSEISHADLEIDNWEQEIKTLL
jgi:hypothetical protein